MPYNKNNKPEDILHEGLEIRKGLSSHNNSNLASMRQPSHGSSSKSQGKGKCSTK